MENSVKSSAVNFGLYLGAVLAAVTVIGYAVDLAILVQWWLAILLLLVIVIFGIISTGKAKKIMGGFISFKEAFTSYFITIVVGVLISATLSYVLFNFVDPDAAVQMKQQIIDNTVNMMEGFGAPPDQIAQQVEELEQQDQFSITATLRSLAFQMIFYIIIGLIVALVMKKTDPQAK